MNYNDMKGMAIYITSDKDAHKIYYRDLYYDPVKKIFIQKPVTRSTCKSASTFEHGEVVRSWVNNLCIHVGRYHVDVNPNWIIEDMRSVQ